MSEEKLEKNKEKNVRKRNGSSQIRKTNTKKTERKNIEKKEGEVRSARKSARVGKKNRNISKEIFKASKLKIIPLGG